MQGKGKGKAMLVSKRTGLPMRVAVVGRQSRSSQSRYRAVFLAPGKGGKPVVLHDLRLEQN